MATAAIPSPPYTYDDPRFVYDELCMFYDGGFDEQCLIDLGKVILPKKIGGSSGARQPRPKEKPPEDCRTILDLTIVSLLCRVNDKEVDKEKVEKRFHLEYDPITVSVTGVKQDKKELNVFMQAITSSVTVPQVCVDPRIKLLPIKTMVSSSFEVRTRKPRVLIKSEIVTKKKNK